MKEFKPLFRNSKFVHVWVSQILSQLTINVMNFLLLIRLFTMTGSAIATSLLWVSYALPAILIGPLAAAVVDLVDKRKVLMVANLVQAAIVLGYGLIHEEMLFLIYGVAFSYSFLNQFYLPAESATIPTVVPKKQLPQANGLFLLTQQGALILGFGMAGTLNHVLGYDSSIFLCSFFLFAAFVSVSFLPRLKPAGEMPHGFEEAVFGFFSRIKEGYDFIRQRHSIFLPFVLLLGIQISLAVIVVNLPVFADKVMEINVNAMGTMMVVPAGLGAVTGALLVPKILRRGIRKKTVIETSLMILSLLLMLLTFLLSQLSFVPRMVVGMVIIYLAGASFVGLTIPSQTFLQEATPGGLRGRVFGNFWFLVTIATILPVIFSGTLSELLGVRVVFLSLGAFALAALIFSKRYGQRLIENGRL